MDNYASQGNSVGYTTNNEIGYAGQSQQVAGVQAQPMNTQYQGATQMNVPQQVPQVPQAQQVQQMTTPQPTTVQQVQATQSNINTLGDRLRAISSTAKPRMELKQLEDTLIQQAEAGYDSVKFTDLRTIIPSIASSGVDELRTWCEREKLKLSGNVNPSTAAWEFVISW